MDSFKIFKGITVSTGLVLVFLMIISPANFGINLVTADVYTGSQKSGALNETALPGKGALTVSSASTSNTLEVKQTVNVSNITPAQSSAQTNNVTAIPFHTGPSNVSPQSSTTKSADVVSVNIKLPSSPSFGPLIANQYSGFEGSDYPASCFCAPPDGNIAVGPNHIFEIVNSEGKIWSKSGTLLETIPMTTFFGTGSLIISDPRVVYDNQSGHWFATISATDFVHNGLVYTAVSLTTDPTGIWGIYQLPLSNIIPDQPRLAVSDDKVTVVASDFPLSGGWTGDEIWVLQKATMIIGHATPFTLLGPDNTRFHIEPAVYPVAGQTDQWLVQDGAGGATAAEYLKITGVPGISPVAYTSMFSTPIAATNSPPGGKQPGTTIQVATNDARILQASMRGSVMTWTANDACIPNLDTITQSCVRWDVVNTSTGILLQDIDFGSPGKDMYYPAVSQDLPASFGVIFDFSSPTEYPSIAFTGQSSVESYRTVDVPVLVKAGTGPDITGRHGDYHAIRADPSTGIYYGMAEYNTADNFWNTWITINSISTGTASSHLTTLTENVIPNVPWGTTVTVTGKLTDNAAGGVGIGGQPITFTGTVQSTVTAPDGTFSTTGIAPGSPPTSVNVKAQYAGTQFFGASNSTMSYNTLKHTTHLSTFPISATAWNHLVPFQALLTDSSAGGIPVSNETITWTGTGVPSVTTAVTDSNGYATKTKVVTNTIINANTVANFAGDANYLPAIGNTINFFAIKHITYLVLWAPQNMTSGSVTTFGATLEDTAYNTNAIPLSGMTITFNGTGVGTILTGTTNANGDVIVHGIAPSTTGTLTVQANFGGTSLYVPQKSIIKFYNTS